jgi:hypothetical protein
MKNTSVSSSGEPGVFFFLGGNGSILPFTVLPDRVARVYTCVQPPSGGVARSGGMI